MKKPTPQKYRVLHIEDNAFDSQWLEARLKACSLSTPIHIVNAERLGLGLSLLSQFDFDLVITDLNLPDSAKIETVEKIQKYFPSIPQLVLTSSDHLSSAAACLKHGALNYFIKKRVKAQTLVNALQAVFKGL